MKILFITPAVLGMSFLTACGGSGDESVTLSEEKVANSVEEVAKSTSKKSPQSNVIVNDKSYTFTFDHQCQRGFHKELGASVSNDDVMLELGENYKTNTWGVIYSIPLGNYKYTGHKTLESTVSFKNNSIEGTALVQQDTDPSIKHKISFSIDCTNSDI